MGLWPVSGIMHRIYAYLINIIIGARALNKKNIFVTLAGIVLAMTSLSSVYAEDYKIGAVNAIKILEQSPQAE